METRHPEDEILQGWAEGGLPRCDSEEVSAHLATCPECREKAGAYRAIFTALEEEVPPAPGELLPAVLSALRLEPGIARPSNRRFALKVAAVAAAAALVFGVVALGPVEKAWELVPAASSKVGEGIPDDFGLPGDLDRAMEVAFDSAEGTFAEAVGAARDTFGSRGAGSAPVVAVLALAGLVNLAALWKLRASAATE